jgi:hypothetical protein
MISKGPRTSSGGSQIRRGALMGRSAGIHRRIGRSAVPAHVDVWANNNDAGKMPALRPMTLALLVGLAFAGSATPALAADTSADVTCKLTPKPLVYACTITLRDGAGGPPLEGIDLTVGADMPSMPMAHNVRPVKAKPGSAPGVYEAELELEMHGDWALRLRLAGPRTDLVVRRLRFEPGSAVPAR